MTIPPHVHEAVRQIADDRSSGATALVSRGLEILRSQGNDREVLAEITDLLVRAQPSMAAFRTISDLVRNSSAPDQDLDRLAYRVRRAPELIARIAVPLIKLRRSTGPLHIVTCSRSAAVEHTLVALSRTEQAMVCCAESRPGREGIGLAEALIAAGVPATIYSDAGISSAVAGADAVVVGADAVSRAGFINKVGTAALIALARMQGISVFVLAGSEKVVSETMFSSLPLIEGPADELAIPAGLPVSNPYFERVPAGSPDLVVTDIDARPYEAIVVRRILVNNTNII